MECGQSVATFWDSAPKEYRAVVKGAVAAMKRQRDLALAAAWHGAWLTAYAPAKSSEFMRLDRLLGGPAKPKDVDPDAEFRAFQAWAQSFEKRR